ncbi:YlqD family protein [Aquibacillus sediminis]|uniref:YlqD family protein n=1 Tax=Aquibacillus sediminis TaxID=2574734 RepID=UPI0011091C1F|nr:YlqD family protein [Aquibacillus sediminis]
MHIIRKIPVKQILTEQSKTKLRNSFLNQQQQLEQECQQLLFEQKKLQRKSGVSQQQEVYKRFQQEITKREQKIKDIDFQLEQLDFLPLGSEIIERQVESLVEVEEGQDWEELMNDKEIIVKDGIVIQLK